jgi:hypothetical protein
MEQPKCFKLFNYPPKNTFVGWLSFSIVSQLSDQLVWHIIQEVVLQSQLLKDLDAMTQVRSKLLQFNHKVILYCFLPNQKFINFIFDQFNILSIEWKQLELISDFRRNLHSLGEKLHFFLNHLLLSLISLSRVY